jgi:hypothetical protein
MTDVIDELAKLDPALSGRVQAAIAADAHAMRVNNWRLPVGKDNACAGLVAELNDAERRAIAVWVRVTTDGYRPTDDYLRWRARQGLRTALARRRLRWSAGEAQAFFDRYFQQVAGGPPYYHRWELAFALSAVEGLDESELADLIPALTKLRDHERSKHEDTTVLRRALATLERAGVGEDVMLPKYFLLRWDTFGPKVIAEFADDLTDPRFIALLLHCSALSTVRPSQKWTKRYRELAEAIPKQSAALSVRVLTMLREHESAHFEDVPDLEYVSNRYIFLGTPVSEFVRGVVWGYAATAETSPDAIRLLGEIAVRCSETVRYTAQQRDPKVSSASIAALGSIGGEAAVTYLRRIQTSVRHKTVQKAVAAALEDAAIQAGLTPRQIVERGIPTHGVEAMDDTVLKSKNKDVKKTLQTERDRLEGLLAADPRWTGAEWSQFYVSHPLTGAHARRLVWEASSDEGQTWFAGLPMPVADNAADASSAGDVTDAPSAWQLDAPDGSTHRIAAADTIRLWHPIHHSVADIRTWREHLTDRQFRQPFKQVFREIYLLTPAEETTSSYSNRFAAHILHANQAKALSITRGWTGLQVGRWSSGYEAEAVKDFAGAGWRARFFVSLVEEADRPYGDELCATDQVRFERRQGRQWQQADLVDVPPCVLSEAFRDVDLFVGVAGIAADPAWTDGGNTGHRAYWHRQSFGELNESAQTRREALARLLPGTKIAARVTLTDRFLEVRGDLRTYKIHLGSGNILMEPDNAYLCIVGARKGTDKRVFLPFEEDGGLLSMILSKAFLLAADTKITDTTITSQIRR